jgi:hypothetical protein
MNELDLLWQRHEIQHRLTVRVVEAFPEDKLLSSRPLLRCGPLRKLLVNFYNSRP